MKYMSIKERYKPTENTFHYLAGRHLPEMLSVHSPVCLPRSVYLGMSSKEESALCCVNTNFRFSERAARARISLILASAFSNACLRPQSRKLSPTKIHFVAARQTRFTARHSLSTK